MDFFASGICRNDLFQFIENRVVKARLLSVHGAYFNSTMRFVDYCALGIRSVADAREKLASFDKKISCRDARLGKKYTSVGFDSFEVLKRLDKATAAMPYLPQKIMLDSGAFTAWTKGGSCSAEEVSNNYASFIEKSGCLFDEIFLVNLDVIPGRFGSEPTSQQVDKAGVESIKNFNLLQNRFPGRVLPVFHQGEDNAYLAKLVSLAENTSGYLCLSPRNDLAESRRIAWARDTSWMLKKTSPSLKLHGLATMGAAMSREISWDSGDSAAWIQNSGFGMIDCFVPEHLSVQRKDTFKSFRISDVAKEVTESQLLFIEEASKELGLTFDALKYDYRLRDIFNIHNRNKLAAVVGQAEKTPKQEYLL